MPNLSLFLKSHTIIYQPDCQSKAIVNQRPNKIVKEKSIKISILEEDGEGRLISVLVNLNF